MNLYSNDTCITEKTPPPFLAVDLAQTGEGGLVAELHCTVLYVHNNVSPFEVFEQLIHVLHTYVHTYMYM